MFNKNNKNNEINEIKEIKRKEESKMIKPGDGIVFTSIDVVRAIAHANNIDTDTSILDKPRSPMILPR